MLRILEQFNCERDTYKLLVCDKCGAKFASMNDDITECQVCNKTLYNKKDTSSDAEEYKKIRYDENYAGKFVFEPNEEKGVYWYRLGFISEPRIYKENRYDDDFIRRKEVAKCLKCEAIKITESIEKDYDDMVCNVCKLKLVVEATKAAEKRWTDNFNTARETAKKEEANLKIVSKELEDEEEANNVIGKKDSWFYRANNKLKSLNSNISLAYVNVINGVKKVKIRCNTCGCLDEVNYNNIKDIVGHKCKGCEIIKTKDPSYVGILKRDLKDTTKNYLYVTKTYENTVDIKCHLCNKKYESINKLEFLQGKIYCNCGNDIIDIRCPICGYVISISIKELYKDNKFMCNKCGNKLPKYYFTNEIESVNKHVETRVALDRTAKYYKDTLEVIGDIAKTTDTLYVDNEGNHYYNCRCLKHHQSMIMKYSDIDGYDHSMCNSKYNLFISDGQINELTFSKKKEIKDE